MKIDELFVKRMRYAFSRHAMVFTRKGDTTMEAFMDDGDANATKCKMKWNLPVLYMDFPKGV